VDLDSTVEIKLREGRLTTKVLSKDMGAKEEL
jgi:hypothetical protein